VAHGEAMEAARGAGRELRAARPLGLRLLNGAGAALRALGLPLVRLDEASLLDAATRAAGGLDDFGDPGFREPLGRLLESYERDARLTLLGRFIVRSDLLRMLEQRLRCEEVWQRHPEIAEGRVERPLFVLGLPRTGTSILHELVAQDPANRVPMTWEVMFPWPPPEAAQRESDPRIVRTDERLGGTDRLIPDFKSMHPMGARLPQECVAITAYEFASIQFHTTHRLPSYQAWLDAADTTWVYRRHRRWLQYLQWKTPAARWVLKSPGHLWTLDRLLAVYPDARIVQTHRDPVRVAASLVSLVCTLRSLASDAVDAREVAADWCERLAAGLSHTMAVRDSGALPPERVFDVAFPEFMRDEIAMVRRIYDHFGMELSAEAEARMRAFLAENRADKHGRHRYGLGVLDEATERRRFRAYQERHAIAPERV
jgi:hypothetical protein